MSHLIQTAVWSAREGAGWTGLGQVIPAEIAKDPRKIAELCGALFNVVKLPIFYNNPIGGQPMAIKNRVALVRSDDGSVLEIPSESSYHVENRQPIDIFESFRDDLAKEGLEISHAAVLKGGAYIAVSARLPGMDIDVGGRGDIVQQYITGSTGFDLQHGTRYMRNSQRVVCMNTLQMAMEKAARGEGRRATVSASQRMTTTTLAEMVAHVKKAGQDDAAKFSKLAQTNMSRKAVLDFLADCLEIDPTKLKEVDDQGKPLVSKRAQSTLEALINSFLHAPGQTLAGSAAWGALNAVTHYATHTKTARDTKGDGKYAARVQSNMIGSAADLKERAFNLAMAYAEQAQVQQDVATVDGSDVLGDLLNKPVRATRETVAA